MNYDLTLFLAGFIITFMLIKKLYFEITKYKTNYVVISYENYQYYVITQ